MRYQEPENRVVAFLLVTLLLGGLVGLGLGVAESSVMFGLEAGLFTGVSAGLIVQRPTRWELRGQVLRVIEPPWSRETRADLAQVARIERVPRVKGGFDAFLVASSGHRISMPAAPGRRAALFREALLANVPERALTQIKDPLLLELLVAADP